MYRLQTLPSVTTSSSGCRSLKLYDEMRGYASHEVILLAARECALVGGDTEKVLTTLKVWKNKGVTTSEQV